MILYTYILEPLKVLTCNKKRNFRTVSPGVKIWCHVSGVHSTMKKVINFVTRALRGRVIARIR